MSIDKQDVKPLIDKRYLILMTYYLMFLEQDQQLTLMNYDEEKSVINKF